MKLNVHKFHVFLCFSITAGIMFFVNGCRKPVQCQIQKQAVIKESELTTETGFYPIIPKPGKLISKAGVFILSEKTHIVVSKSLRNKSVMKSLTTRIRDLTGFELSESKGREDGTSINLVLNTDHSLLGDEGYMLDINPAEVKIRARTPAGLFYGVQSLCQLIPFSDGRQRYALSCASITDIPEFKWRGSMLDVSRHFFTTQNLKRYIDLLALYKINVLHLHLTDDQGWRIAIKKYPKLTEVGAWRTEDGKRYGGFYTQDEMRELINYAAERFIEIVPEIDMPGHSQAALAAYPEYSCGLGKFDVRVDNVDPGDAVFCAGNEQTYKFIADIMDEIMKVFPSKYIHIGADEVSTKHWEKCPKCRKLMKIESIKSPKALQGYFARRVAAHINSCGRKMICWDDLLEDSVPAGAAIMFWRTWTGSGLIRAAALSGHDLILAPISHYYLSGEPLPEYIYTYSPAISGLTGAAAERVIGGTAALWTEHITTWPDVERISFPRLCAFSETVWTTPQNRNWGGFVKRMWHHYSLLEVDRVNVTIPEPGGFVDRTLFVEPFRVEISAPEISTVYYTIDGTEPTRNSALCNNPIDVESNMVLSAMVAYPDGRCSAARKGIFRRVAPINPVKTKALLSGINYRYYEGTFDEEPSISNLDFVRDGTVSKFMIPDGLRNDNFALEFDGLIHIDTAGTYTFSTRSDDGSRLWIGKELVVDNWGFRPLQKRSGRLFLKAGYYPIHVEMVEASGDEILDVLYSGSGISYREIPAEALFRGEEIYK
jgi:hexosaminidase